MAVNYQSVGTAVSGTASVNVSWPIGHTTNDIGILVLESATAIWTTPSGWTLVASSDAVTTELNIYWKRAASGAEAAVATGFPSGADHVVARIFTFRGCVATGSPVLTSATSTKIVASTSWSAPSITTTTASEFVVYGVSRDNDSATTISFGNPTNANLVSPTEAGEAGTISGNGGGFAVGYGVKTAAGATGTTTGTVSSSANASITFSLAEQLTLNVTVGAFTLSGTTTGLLKSSKIDATVGAFTFTGNNLILSPTVALNTTVGAFNLTGNSVDLTYTPVAGPELICQLGSFTWTGISSILTQQLILNNTVGSFAVNGLSLNQQRLFLLNGNTESFLVDGKFISLSLGKNLNTTTGTFLLNGINLDSAFTYAIIGSKGSFLIGFKPADVAKNFQLISSTGTYTITGISSDAVKNYPIVALPQSYLVEATGIDYFSTRRLEASTAPFVMRLQSNGDFFWYQTTQTIPIIKPRLTNRNQWILGRATHMGRRGL